MRDLIVETDLGRDPDDFFALCYLISSGNFRLRLITISPGDPDQVAVARFLLHEVRLDIPVGVGRMGRDEKSVSGVHRSLLHRYGFPTTGSPDGYGPDLIQDVLIQSPECDLFVCGPLNSVGKYLRMHPEAHLGRATMQGGFCGYHLHGQEVVKLAKFEGKDTQPTFNLAGDLRGAEAFLDARIDDRRFVPKSLCHTVVYSWDVQREAVKYQNCRAKELLNEGMGIYLSRHPGGKKFHDPLAAVAHAHPELFTWVTGKLYRRQGEWGTSLSAEGDQIAIDVDRDAFWDRIQRGV